MNEKEMIEEMAEIIFNSKYKNDYISPLKGANELYNAGYRKPLEGSVVLSKEQNEKWLEWLEQNIEKARKETLEKIKLTPIECGEECGHYYLDISVTGKELLQRVYFTSSFIDGEIRKETAKEILQEIKLKCKELENKYSHICKSKKECVMETCRYEGVLAVKRELYELAKEFGVEV